jgi:PAS domain S-box-containing protein
VPPPRQSQQEQAGASSLSLATGEIEAILNAEARGICVTTPDGECRYVTQHLCDLLGYPRDEMLGCPVKLFIPSSEANSSRSDRSRSRVEECQIRRKDGHTFPARVEICELSAGGLPTGMAIFVSDVSEEKHIEEVLQKTEKLASAGRMAAAIAQEINNPLAAVTNLLFLLRNQELGPESVSLLSLAEAEIARVSRIAQQTLGFYRDSGKLSRIDLRELLNMSIDIHTMRSPGIRVHRRYRTAPMVSGNASQLQQVFHNLVAHSVEAGATDLWVHLHSRSSSPRYRPGVLVTIADNGNGIDPSVRQRIFDPFITTKGEKGTGLGLWVTRGIVLRHEGDIRVRTSTRPGCSGTCMTIFLPQ